MDSPEATPAETNLPPNIRHAPGLTLSAAEMVLLARAFANSPEIFVERKFRSGYSGAVVLLVWPGPGQAQVVVKLAPLADLQREYAAYRQFVEKASPQNTARLQGEPLLADDGQLALLSYTFAGGDPRLPTHSLQSYYESQGGQATAAVLDRVFRVYGRQWWAVNHPRKFVLAEQYDRLLPVHLKLKHETATETKARILVAGRINATTLRDLQPGQPVDLRGFCVAEVRPDRSEVTLTADPPPGEASAPLRLHLETEDVTTYQPGDRVKTVEALVTATRQTWLAEAARSILPTVDPNAPQLVLDDRSYPNPLHDLSGLLDRVVEARVSTIHGDLNLQNILVDETTGFAWLIDFAETRSGPTLFDLQRLEGQIITKLLPPAVAQAGLEPVAVADLLEALHADPPRSAAPHIALQEPYTVLVALRRLVRQYLMDDRDWDEYYLGLIVALLGSLKYTEMEPSARGLALVGAAAARELLGQPMDTLPLAPESNQPRPIFERSASESGIRPPQHPSRWPRWLTLLGAGWFKPKPALPLALIINVQGRVDVCRKTGDRLIPAAFGMQLFFEDAVITYENSISDIVCNNGFLFHLDKHSTLVVRCGEIDDPPPIGLLPSDLSPRLTRPGVAMSVMFQTDLAVAEEAIRALPLNERGQSFLRARLYQSGMLPDEAIVELEALASQGMEPGLAQALGDAYFQAGSLDSARANYTTALNAAYFRGDPIGQAEARAGLGHVARTRDEVEAATAHWQTAEELYQQAGCFTQAEQVAGLLPTIPSESPRWPWLTGTLGRFGRWLKKLWLADLASVPVEEKESASTRPVIKYLWSALNLVGSAILLLLFLIAPLVFFGRTFYSPTFTGPTPTSIAAVVDTPTAIPTPSPSPSPAPTATPTPSSTMTPAPLSGEMGGVLEGDLNVFSGPGTHYPFIGNVNRDVEVLVTGRDPSGNWWQIAYPEGPGGYGWVEAQFVKVEGASVLPTAVASPPPTFTPTPTATFTPIPTPTPIPPTVTLLPTPTGSPTSAADVPRELARNTVGYDHLHWSMGQREIASQSFSPDGTEIAVTEGIKLYIIAKDGTYGDIWVEEDEHLRPVEGVVWSPNGAYVAFVADRKQNCNPCRTVGILIRSDKALGPVYLEQPEGHNIGLPRWSQDGRLLVTIYRDDPANGTAYVYDISGQFQVATGSYVLSSSHEGQKWFPWKPGRTWQVSQDQPHSYYND